MSKTIKIPSEVHKELKVFVAQVDNVTIEEFAGFAIMKELAAVGHKFTKPQPKSKLSKK